MGNGIKKIGKLLDDIQKILKTDIEISSTKDFVCEYHIRKIKEYLEIDTKV